MAKKARRTTHRSSTGTKLYAVRDAKGRFKDIQTYTRAHGQDIKRRATGEKYRLSRTGRAIRDSSPAAAARAPPALPRALIGRREVLDAADPTPCRPGHPPRRRRRIGVA